MNKTFETLQDFYNERNGETMDPIQDQERRLAMLREKAIDDGQISDYEYNAISESQNKIDEIFGIVNDDVNHPSHYCNRAMEAIDIIEMIIEIEPNPKVAYNMSNVLKYLLRFRDKGKPIHDLKKAVWYLNRMISKIEQEEE